LARAAGVSSLRMGPHGFAIALGPPPPSAAASRDCAQQQLKALMRSRSATSRLARGAGAGDTTSRLIQHTSPLRLRRNSLPTAGGAAAPASASPETAEASATPATAAAEPSE